MIKKSLEDSIGAERRKILYGIRINQGITSMIGASIVFGAIQKISSNKFECSYSDICGELKNSGWFERNKELDYAEIHNSLSILREYCLIEKSEFSETYSLSRVLNAELEESVS